MSAAAKVEVDERGIHARMVAILGELPAIGKTEYNEQQRFHYRGFDSMLTALNPLLAKHGVYVVPDVVERITAQRMTRNNSVMYEVNLHVRFTFYGLAGDYIEASGWGEGTDMGDKATNKAMTAAFKYVLNQTFAISNSEAADSDASGPDETIRREAAAPPTEVAPRLANERQIKKVGVLRGRLGTAGLLSEEIYRKVLKNEYGVEHTAELTNEKISHLISRLETYAESIPKEAPAPEAPVEQTAPAEQQTLAS